jgi:hypothetical protein
MAITSELRQLVWSRASNLCKYCRMPDEFDPLPFAIDHIRPQYHHGPTAADNLCVCCFSCNSFKAVNIAGHDPETGLLTRLFHPREDRWEEHFSWDGPEMLGRTPVGRTTIDVLRINLPERVEHRRLLLQLGVFPPELPRSRPN